MLRSRKFLGRSRLECFWAGHQQDQILFDPHFSTLPILQFDASFVFLIRTYSFCFVSLPYFLKSFLCQGRHFPKSHLGNVFFRITDSAAYLFHNMYHEPFPPDFFFVEFSNVIHPLVQVYYVSPWVKMSMKTSIPCLFLHVDNLRACTIRQVDHPH